MSVNELEVGTRRRERGGPAAAAAAQQITRARASVASQQARFWVQFQVGFRLLRLGSGELTGYEL